MCGLAGFLGPDPSGCTPESILERMNRALAHRGPDGKGIHCRDGVGLAHTRLVLVDRAGGGQPLHSEDGQTVVVLNGEIYNHEELRRDLIRAGRRFRTRSDTEVLLQLFEAEGTRCVDRLRGMFAFAVWSQRTRELWLARDRLGVKPLYYHWDGRTFVFGSELKAVLEHPAVHRVVDETAIDDFFTFGYVPSPRTILRGVRKLEPGHTLLVSARGLTDTRYWDLEFVPDRPAGRAAEEELTSLLRQAVVGEMGADVPVGTLLSGGIDSTAVLGFMTERLGRGVPAFTATFPDITDPDRSHAILAAETYGARWREVPVPEPGRETLDRLAWHFDEPFADPSSLPTFLVCGEARRSVTAVLTGDGADESFAGYRRYRTNEARRSVRHLVAADRAPAILAAMSRVTPDGPWVPKALRLGALLRGAAICPRDSYRREMSITTPETKQRFYGARFKGAIEGHDPFAILNGHLARAEGWDSTSQLQYADLKTYLPDDILTKADRASMAHGLEARVPLLDHALVEMVARLPTASKVSPGRGKRILRKSLRGLVPDPILRRRKRGFTPPVARWLDEGLGAVLEDRVLQGDSFASSHLDIAGLRRIWSDQRSGSRSHTQLLWAVLMLESWGRRFL
jgi:asparagine synthase (glutamine-hydrolysing)